ncbi:MAG: hypothetical protein WC856_25545 [Methylococcaceae bacterium]|jgi:hypothetical protein
MLKVYKRTIHIGQTEVGHRLESSMNTSSMKMSDWLTITAMIAGAIIGTLVFSVFFVAILIPLGLLGLGAWLRLRQLKNSQMDQSIEAEYTVITDTAKKDP